MINGYNNEIKDGWTVWFVKFIEILQCGIERGSYEVNKGLTKMKGFVFSVHVLGIILECWRLNTIKYTIVPQQSMI